MPAGPLHPLLISVVPPIKGRTLSRLNRIVMRSVSCSSAGIKPSLLFLLQAVLKSKKTQQQSTSIRHSRGKKAAFFLFHSSCHSFSPACPAQRAPTCTNQSSSCKQHGISATISLLLSNILVVIMSHMGKGERGK